MYDVHQITVPEFWPVSFDHHHIISYAIAFWLFVVFVFPAKIKNETVSPFKQKICKVNHVCMQRPGSGVTIIGGHGVWDPDHRCAPEKFWGSDFSFWGLGGSPILGGSARVWGVLPIQSISSKKFLRSKNVCGGPKTLRFHARLWSGPPYPSWTLQNFRLPILCTGQTPSIGGPQKYCT